MTVDTEEKVAAIVILIQDAKMRHGNHAARYKRRADDVRETKKDREHSEKAYRMNHYAEIVLGTLLNDALAVAES